MEIGMRWGLWAFPTKLHRITADQSGQLDSLRGLSAYIVLVGHANQIIINPVYSGAVRYFGLFTQLAVMMFFVLSGFFIGRSLLNNSLRNGQFNLSRYLIDRATRIYPALIFSVILMGVLWLLAPVLFESGTRHLIPMDRLVRPGYLLSLKDTMGSLVFLNGFGINTPSPNGPLWSLSFEVWYYVLGAAIFLARSRIAAALVLVTLTLYVTHENGDFYYYMPVWASGLLIAVGHERIIKIPPLILYLSFGALLAWSIYLANNYLSSESFDLEALQRYVRVSGIAFAAFMVLILAGLVRVPRIMAGSAKYSYTLYIIHMPIMLFVLGIIQTFTTSSIYNAIFVSALSVVLIAIVSKFIAVRLEDKHTIRRWFSSIQPLILARRNEDSGKASLD